MIEQDHEPIDVILQISSNHKVNLYLIEHLEVGWKTFKWKIYSKMHLQVKILNVIGCSCTGHVVTVVCYKQRFFSWFEAVMGPSTWYTCFWGRTRQCDDTCDAWSLALCVNWCHSGQWFQNHFCDKLNGFVPEVMTLMSFSRFLVEIHSIDNRIYTAV